jgi:endo-beta-N-acetylglucosaminidase D
MQTKKELYEIYKRQGGKKLLEELKNPDWTMLSLICYVEKSKDNGIKSKMIFLDDLDRKDEVERNKELEAEWEKHKKEKENEQ